MERAKRIAKRAEDSLQGALAVAQEVTTKAGDVTVHAQAVHEELQDARQVYEDTVKLQEEVSRQTKTAVTKMENLHRQVTGLAHKTAEEKRYYREKAEAMRKELTHKMEEAQRECAAHISAAHTFETSLKMHAEQAQTIVEVAEAENERDGRQRPEELTQATKLVQHHASQVWQWLQTANREAEDHRNNSRNHTVKLKNESPGMKRGCSKGEHQGVRARALMILSAPIAPHNRTWRPYRPT